MQPKLSIIVPIYNVGDYLKKCIESVLAQSFSDFELILIDDGSTDQSGEICDAYAETDQRIKVIHKPNEGVSSARNTGIRAANGSYIGFVDPDDWISQEMYQTLYDLLQKTGSDIAICKFKREIDGNIVEPEKIEPIIKELNHIEALNELFKGQLYRFSLCNKLFKKKCFEKISFPEGRIHEDLSTTYKLFARADKVVYTSYAGYIYVKREGSILNAAYARKRLQAFIGWQEIIEYMEIEYPTLLERVRASFTYWCIDNIHYVLQQVTDQNQRAEFLESIQGYTRKYKSGIINNKFINVKGKVILSLFNIDIRLISTIYSSRKRMT